MDLPTRSCLVVSRPYAVAVDCAGCGRMSAGSDAMSVTMLLCDAAQEVKGKLFILGGGWNVLTAAGTPVSMALAVKVGVPWLQTNDRHRITAQLVTQDGALVVLNDSPVRVEGEFEVGRPPGVPAGSSFNVPLAFSFQGLVLEQGEYRWELTIDGSLEARESFRVVAGPK